MDGWHWLLLVQVPVDTRNGALIYLDLTSFVTLSPYRHALRRGQPRQRHAASCCALQPRIQPLPHPQGANRVVLCRCSGGGSYLVGWLLDDMERLPLLRNQLTAVALLLPTS